jgi:hypothetical protein
MAFLLVDYLPLVSTLRDSIVQQAETAPLRVISRLDAFVDISRNKVLRGDVVLAKLNKALDSCGLERTETQRFFHKMFTLSVLPWVYGSKDFSQFRERILFENGVPSSDKYNQCTLISTPRRWGKTTSVALFCAAMLFSVPEAWIAVFSTGRRASSSLSEMVQKFIKRLEESAKLSKSKVLVKNWEQLFYEGDVASDVRRMYSYPATVQAGGIRAP